MNNLEIIKNLLEFSSGDDFYFIQLIQRKKEHPELGSNSRVIKSYFVSSISYLDKVFPDIERMCNLFNARAYINLNRRSFKRIAFQTLKKITDQILNEDYTNVKACYTSTCGSFSNEKDKKWLLDVDDLNFNALNFKAHIYNLRPFGDKFLEHIPTKSGYHLILKPFDISKLCSPYDTKIFKDSLKKDSLTLLYFP